ncbi:hypothetical protein B0T10DRAFT_590832 [Thelonectria olida]|uniref:NmrA-like domain-containing protein n=1 Tax=Thelonectria olida TaxID=1576542 RepID=A0A9P8VTN7_9HYPO|nr:hypothetical protein B0T10DRAFT_590832 [Thelonectria olida]
MSKLLTVFGATGNQGGSVIRAVLNDPVLSKEFRIRAITRDVSKPAAKELVAKGVEVVAADMSSAEQAAPAVEGAHTVFLVTNYWETMSAEVELSHGKAVTDASKAAGVQHLIFSSELNTTEISNGALPNLHHYVSKANIEQYIRDSGVPGTFVLAGFFMSNLFEAIRKSEDGSYALALPVSSDKAQVPLFDARNDTGKFAVAAIKHYPSSVNERILAATEYYTPARIMSEFSEAIGKPAVSVQIPAEVFKSFLPHAAQELLENMLLLEEPGYYNGADLSESLSRLSEKPTTWKQFVEQNKDQWA